MDLPFEPRAPAKTATIVVSIAYLYLAQRRVYGGGRFANALRTAVLVVAQTALGFLAIWVLLMLTVFLG